MFQSSAEVVNSPVAGTIVNPVALLVNLFFVPFPMRFQSKLIITRIQASRVHYCEENEEKHYDRTRIQALGCAFVTVKRPSEILLNSDRAKVHNAHCQFTQAATASLPAKVLTWMDGMNVIAAKQAVVVRSSDIGDLIKKRMWPRRPSRSTSKMALQQNFPSNTDAPRTPRQHQRQSQPCQSRACHHHFWQYCSLFPPGPCCLFGPTWRICPTEISRHFDLSQCPSTKIFCGLPWLQPLPLST